MSDEDEFDLSGANCIQSYDKMTLEDELIKGRCEERRSELTYTTTQAGVPKCKIAFETAYNYKYTWAQDAIKTTIDYRKIKTAATYSIPQTKISYFVENKTYSSISTTVGFFTKVCTNVVLDGVKVGENCTYPKSSKSPRR